MSSCSCKLVAETKHLKEIAQVQKRRSPNPNILASVEGLLGLPLFTRGSQAEELFHQRHKVKMALGGQRRKGLYVKMVQWRVEKEFDDLRAFVFQEVQWLAARQISDSFCEPKKVGERLRRPRKHCLDGETAGPIPRRSKQLTGEW